MLGKSSQLIHFAMKRYLFSLLLLPTIILSACSGSAYQTYNDSVINFSFQYPAHWDQIQVSEEISVFSTENEEDGLISFQIIDNSTGMDLNSYLLENGVENAEELTLTEVQSYPAHQTDWEGIPDSMQEGKRLYIDLHDEAIILTISTIRTSLTDKDAIEANYAHAIESLSFESSDSLE